MVLAEHLERRLTEEVSRVRPDETPWAVRLGDAQLNAWLALRLPQWVAHMGEPLPAETQVRFLPDVIEIAVRPMASAGTSLAVPGGIGVLRIRPELQGGAVSLRVVSAGVGGLALPGGATDLVLDVAESALRAFAAASPSDGESNPGTTAPVGEPPAPSVAEILRGRPVAARWPLGDGREVELLDLEVVSGEIIVQCVTRRTASP